MRRTYLFASVLFVAAMLLSTLPLNEKPVRAQMQTDGHYQYAVKFICGQSVNPVTLQVLAKGTYFTAINLHNPWGVKVNFRKKFAVALPNEKVGPISHFYDVSLNPDEAFEIDCRDIIGKIPTTVPFVKGFAVIETPRELDVVAVYTAAGSTGSVETMHLERVPPRRIP